MNLFCEDLMSSVSEFVAQVSFDLPWHSLVTHDVQFWISWHVQTCMIPEHQLGLKRVLNRDNRIQTDVWQIILLSSYCLHSLCQCCMPVWLSMRHKSHSATFASPPQSLLHPQNAINVQPSFILIHSPLAQMKWIRNLVGQGRACRLPSVAELFSILLA